MKFGDSSYQAQLKLAHRVGFLTSSQAHIAAHERVLTLEAEIKVLVDGAGKDRAEIERLKKELAHEEGLKEDYAKSFVETSEEVKRLKDDLWFSEARRGELVRALEKINTCEITVADFKAMPLKLAFIKMAETVSKEALASQSRPKILDVLAAARRVGHLPICVSLRIFDPNPIEEESDCNCDLGKALAAMEKE